MHLIDFQLRAIKREGKITPKRPRYCFSPETQASVRCKEAADNCSRSRSSSTLGWYLRVTEDGARRLIQVLKKQT